MAHTYDELKDKKLTDLREIAREVEHPAVRGYSSMHKEHLIHALCEAFGVEEHVHHEVVGIDKASIKAKIRELKVERDAALEARDRVALKRTRRKIHRLKRQIHKATV